MARTRQVGISSVYVCCSMRTPEGALERIAERVQAFGRSALLFPGCWYVETASSALDIKTALASVIGESESLVVVDATNHEAAWKNVRPDAVGLMRGDWDAAALPRPLHRHDFGDPSRGEREEM